MCQYGFRMKWLLKIGDFVEQEAKDAGANGRSERQRSTTDTGRNGDH